MNRKVDFTKITVQDVEGNEQKVDMSKLLGNQLYMEGADIEACELGRKIYFAKDEVDLTDKETEIVQNFITRYSYVIRTAIADMLK